MRRMSRVLRDKSEAIAPGTIRETPEGWCVQTAALARWFGIGVKPVTSGSVLLLQSEAKLPVELAIERQKRAPSISSRRSFDLASLPQVRIPYRMWRAPALDFVVSAGVTYRASDGVRVDRQSSVYAAGEIAHLSYDAQITHDREGHAEHACGLRAYRSDPDGGLLGPLQGDPFRLRRRRRLRQRPDRLGRRAGAARSITNRPLAARAAFDRTRFEGDLPRRLGSRNLPQRRAARLCQGRRPSQRYVFDDVQLLYGENRIQIVLYGPQGQVRTREELINVGQDNVPAGKTWYWAGFNQPGRDMLALRQASGRQSVSPRRRPPSRSSTASTTARRSACSRARC